MDQTIFFMDDVQERIKKSYVRCQWDPERDLYGQPLGYRSIQLGLRGEAVRKYVNEGIAVVKNISWKEFEEKMNLVFGRTFHVVDDLYLNIVRQINFGEWIELDDLEALSYLEKLQKFSGQLCVINDYCYEEKCGPFLLGAAEI